MIDQLEPDTSTFHVASDIPTIYADGVNDDTSGWIACVENRQVLFDGRLYEPNDAICIDRDMKFGVNIIALPHGVPLPDDVDVTWVVVREPSNSRREIYSLDQDISEESDEPQGQEFDPADYMSDSDYR